MRYMYANETNVPCAVSRGTSPEASVMGMVTLQGVDNDQYTEYTSTRNILDTALQASILEIAGIIRHDVKPKPLETR